MTGGSEPHEPPGYATAFKMLLRWSKIKKYLPTAPINSPIFDKKSRICIKNTKLFAFGTREKLGNIFPLALKFTLSPPEVKFLFFFFIPLPSFVLFCPKKFNLLPCQKFLVTRLNSKYNPCNCNLFI